MQALQKRIRDLEEILEGADGQTDAATLTG